MANTSAFSCLTLLFPSLLCVFLGADKLQPNEVLLVYILQQLKT